MARETRPLWRIRADAVRRAVLWDVLSSRLDLYLVAEYPKSGGSWVAEMVADYVDRPFPRNRTARFESSVLHGHRLYRPRFQRALWVLRDGRDIIVSNYFHLLFHSDRNSPKRVEAARRKFGFRDVEAIEQNLPRFIEHLLRHGEGTVFRFTWPEFVASWQASGVPPVRYEELLADAERELGPALERITGQPVDRARLHEAVEKHRFENITGRRRGEEARDSFVRKGIAGDWKNYFNLEARQMFDKLAGDSLIAAGYETGRQWVAPEPRPAGS